jgi:hypothetical protein
MHRDSDAPDLETSVLRMYADESGGDDPGTPHAVIGGLLVNRKKALDFEEKWDQLLQGYGISPPLHMKEFGKDGRFGKMSRCCRKQLIDEAVGLILSHRTGGQSVSLNNQEFKANFPKEVRKEFGLYGMCFTLFSMMTHHTAIQNNYPLPIPYILDDGNSYKHHVVSGHASVMLIQRQGMPLHMGSLTFDDDAVWGLLQAADLIAWGARRRATKLPLNGVFESIKKVFDEYHTEVEWKKEWLQESAMRLASSIKTFQEAKRNGK